MGDQSTFLAEFDRVLHGQYSGDLNHPVDCAACGAPGKLADMVMMLGAYLPTRILCQPCARRIDEETDDGL